LILLSPFPIPLFRQSPSGALYRFFSRNAGPNSQDGRAIVVCHLPEPLPLPSRIPGERFKLRPTSRPVRFPAHCKFLPPFTVDAPVELPWTFNAGCRTRSVGHACCPAGERLLVFRWCRPSSPCCFGPFSYLKKNFKNRLDFGADFQPLSFFPQCGDIKLTWVALFLSFSFSLIRSPPPGIMARIGSHGTNLSAVKLFLELLSMGKVHAPSIVSPAFPFPLSFFGPHLPLGFFGPNCFVCRTISKSLVFDIVFLAGLGADINFLFLSRVLCPFSPYQRRDQSAQARYLVTNRRVFFINSSAAIDSSFLFSYLVLFFFRLAFF